MSQRAAHTLLVAVVCVMATHVAAKCLGSACRDMEQYAASHGLLGGSVSDCRGRDRTFPFRDEWQTALHSELLKLAWSGGDDQWVWAITTGSSDEASVQVHHVYWSQDHGKTLRDRWDDLVDKVKGYRGSSYDFERDYVHASCNGVIVHTGDPKRAILWGDGLYNFLTKDGGSTFEIVPLPENTLGLAHQVRQHPTQPDWLLSLAYRDACYQYGETGCAMDLFLSKDFGSNWQNLTRATGGQLAGFIDFDWGYHNGDDKYRRLFSETSIVATGHTRYYESMNDIPNTDLHLWRSDDNFATVQRLAHCGAAVELVAGQVFFVHPDVCPVAVDGTRTAPKSEIRDALTLYVSHDGRTFSEVCMPTELADSAYTMVSTQDGRGNFMIADHKDQGAAVSNLYANGNIAELYTLSLRNIHFGFRRGSRPDIRSMLPVPARYIANKLASKTPGATALISDRDFDAVTLTQITHNAGASWEHISVDPRNVRNEVCKAGCVGGSNCYLHLHGASSWVRGTFERPSVYAAPSAPGLVMASGNLGPQSQGLKMDKDKLCTWLSRDGGETWVDVVDDVYIYEFLNHGNIIAMAKFREEGPAEFLHVSLDQGQCFYSIALKNNSSDIELFVNNIFVEPDGAATIAHVAATQHIKTLNRRNDVLITIDVKAVLDGKDVQQTSLPPRSKCSDDDFEQWKPSDSSGQPHCILGQSYSFKRMRETNRQDPCFLEKDFFLPKPASSECNCVRQDLYCEYGFEKLPERQSECVQVTVGRAPKCAAIEEERYVMSSSHFRLPHGAVCPNIKSLIPDTDGNGNMGKEDWSKPSSSRLSPSPSTRKPARRGHGWLWFVVVVLLAGAFGAFCVYGPEQVREVGAAASEVAVSIALWAVDSVRSFVRRAGGANPEEMGFERLADSNQDSLYAVP